MLQLPALFSGAGGQSFEGNLTAGEFMGFISALLLAYQPLRSVANLPVVLQEGVAAGLRVFEIIDKPIEINNKPDAGELKISKGGIEFKNVSFAYGNRDISALDDISIDINPGETVALVGPSGAGKSTLLNLVLRFYDPVSGSIEIDGQDIQTVTIESLRASTALVTQEPFLFDDTIAANIAYGQDNASQKALKRPQKALLHMILFLSCRKAMRQDAVKVACNYPAVSDNASPLPVPC